MEIGKIVVVQPKIIKFNSFILQEGDKLEIINITDNTVTFKRINGNSVNTVPKQTFKYAVGQD